MNLNKLKEPFDIDKISWRVGATNKEKTKGIALAYIDARDVMERLDEVCGVENWQCTYSHAGQKTICDLSIRINGEWITKSGGAGDTQIEAEKGAISDAMKRAAVLWGIGRYLYDCPNVWVELDQYKKIANPEDPRLEGALKKAAAGVRPINIGLPKEEIEQYKDELYACETLDDLKAEFTRIYALKDLMTAKQLQTLEGAKDQRKTELTLKEN